MTNCRPNQRKLCGKKECKICFEKSFASYKGRTKTGKLKVDCWSEKNKTKPWAVFRSEKKEYWFECEKCNHSFYSRLKSITIKNCWCNFCCFSPKKLCGNKDCKVCFEKSFASIDENIVKCWGKKNNKSAHEIFKNSNKKYWFDCNKCNHSFCNYLSSITRQKYLCNFCSKKNYALIKNAYSVLIIHLQVLIKIKYHVGAIKTTRNLGK
tara:strand:- start:681 stop:1307 length:627 start_codon:yes stop_codon:yes gene_type:complete